MRSSRAFRDFALDQLSDVHRVTARAMFGGIGLYAGDVFFGIIANDILYLKVNDSNRSQYEAAGSRAFRPFADRAMVMPYYEVPVGVLESANTLAAWARASIGIASVRTLARAARTPGSKAQSKTPKQSKKSKR